MGLSDFYHREALDYQKERLGTTYVFLYENVTLGFVTLSMNKIDRDLILEKKDRLPLRQRQYPAALIGRLAIDNKWRDMGVGTYICKWTIGRCIWLSQYIGCCYVLLQTDSFHKAWYQREELKFKLFDVTLNKKSEIDYWLYHKFDI